MTTLFMSDAQLNSLTALVYSNPFLKEDKHSPFREATSRWLTAKDPSDPSKTYCRHVKLRKLDLPHLTWLWVEYRRVWPPFLADGRTAARITTMRYDGESLSQWTVGWAVRYLVDYLGWMRRNESILVWRLKRVQAAGTDEAKQIADARAVVRERGAQTEALIRAVCKFLEHVRNNCEIKHHAPPWERWTGSTALFDNGGDEAGKTFMSRLAAASERITAPTDYFLRVLHGIAANGVPPLPEPSVLGPFYIEHRVDETRNSCPPLVGRWSSCGKAEIDMGHCVLLHWRPFRNRRAMFPYGVSESWDGTLKITTVRLQWNDRSIPFQSFSQPRPMGWPVTPTSWVDLRRYATVHGLDVSALAAMAQTCVAETRGLERTMIFILHYIHRWKDRLCDLPPWAPWSPPSPDWVPWNKQLGPTGTVQWNLTAAEAVMANPRTPADILVDGRLSAFVLHLAWFILVRKHYLPWPHLLVTAVTGEKKWASAQRRALHCHTCRKGKRVHRSSGDGDPPNGITGGIGDSVETRRGTGGGMSALLSVEVYPTCEHPYRSAEYSGWISSGGDSSGGRGGGWSGGGDGGGDGGGGGGGGGDGGGGGGGDGGC